MSVEEQIRAVIADHAKLAIDASKLGIDSDLFQAGMTSHTSVNVMLALEDEFDIEFPVTMLRKSTFESISAIQAAVLALGVANDRP